MEDKEQEQPRIDPVAPTADMKLPDGSTVVQAIMHRNLDGDGGTLDVRCVLIGSTVYDPANPAHRFAMAVQQRIPEIMKEITGGEAHMVDSSEINSRLDASQQAAAAGLTMNPQMEAAAKEKLVKGLIATGHTREQAEEMVDGITVDQPQEMADPDGY